MSSEPGYEFVRYEMRGHIAYIILNRPQVLNATHPPMHAELDRIWASFMEDDDLWVAILTGSGERAFCAGNDIKYRAAEASDDELRTPTYRPSILDRCWKPIIAAVNGYALGGGLHLALRCDLIVAAEHAQFGLPEARRGQIDETGAIKLPKRIPYHLAMDLLLTGRLISAQEAHRMGLVNEVVAKEQLLPAAERWANEILQCAPLSVRAIKQAALTLWELPSDVGLTRVESLDAVRQLRSSQDYREGLRAFVEKRKPEWKGQ